MIAVIKYVFDLFTTRKPVKQFGRYPRKPVELVEQSDNYSHKPWQDYTSFYPADDDLHDTFYANLLQTIAWTEKIVDQVKDDPGIHYGQVLRSTNPVYEGQPFYTNDTTAFQYGFNYAIVLADALAVRNNAVLPDNQIAGLGRILRFWIDVTTHDAVAVAESEGFVDESDIPPIDTWFYVNKKHLYCWIPAMFIGKMQDAIDVEILGSYDWLDALDPKLNQQIVDKIQLSIDQEKFL